MSEEVKYIYESPDGGKTVTRREFGSLNKEEYYGTPEFSDEDYISSDTNYTLDVSALDVGNLLVYTGSSFVATDISVNENYNKSFNLFELHERLETIEKRLTILVPDAKLLEQYQVLQDLYAQYKAAESLLFGPEIEDEK